jgi:hypothetical protein
MPTGIVAGCASLHHAHEKNPKKVFTARWRLPKKTNDLRLILHKTECMLSFVVFFDIAAA